jgi:tRNA U34 5-carboxymethylaminomethyl modifying enzyme MnmG/GidA
MDKNSSKQKTVVIGAGPVGALAALYAAQRGDDVEIYELRSGTCRIYMLCCICSVGFVAHTSIGPEILVFVLCLVANHSNTKLQAPSRILRHPI